MPRKHPIKHRRIGALIPAVALTLSIAACGGSSGSADGSADGVTVGLLANLTGGAADSFGVPFRNGFDLALSDAKSELDDAGLSVDELVEDSKSEVTSAVTGYNKLRQDGAVVVINDSQSPLGQAVAPLANEDKIAFLSGAGSELENPDGFAFRFTDLGTPTLAMGQYLVDHGATKVGVVVASDNPSFTGLADATAKSLPNGYASEQEVSSTDSDFSAVIANLRKDGVDAIVLSVLPAQAGNLLLQLRQEGGFDDVLLAGTVATSSETYTVAKDAAAGFIFPQVWAPGMSGGTSFESAYEAEYGELPTAYGALGYQNGWILVAALIAADQAGTINGTAIRDALPAASESDLVTTHGVLSLKLSAGGSATSEGVLASFDDQGTIVAAGE